MRRPRAYCVNDAAAAAATAAGPAIVFVVVVVDVDDVVVEVHAKRTPWLERGERSSLCVLF